MRGFVLIEGAASELKADGIDFDHLTPAHIERLIVAVCSLPALPLPYTSLVDYFLACYRDVSAETRKPTTVLFLSSRFSICSHPC